MKKSEATRASNRRCSYTDIIAYLIIALRPRFESEEQPGQYLGVAAGILEWNVHARRSYPDCCRTLSH
jgi:hypothetical protein